MTRVAEHIERHVKRALHVTKEKTKSTVNRAGHMARAVKNRFVDMRIIWIALCILGGLLLITAMLYLWEKDSVEKMTQATPIPCATFLFTANGRLCEDRISSLYETVESRGPLCAKRNQYGQEKAMLCDEYDAFITETLHGSSLSERGVSLWMPTTDVTERMLVAKTMTAASDANLVCGSIIPTITAIDDENIRMETLTPIDAQCVIIATTIEGSVTSAPFNLTTQ